ncbi:MAG: amino acid permease [Spirochaetota bacterium]
MSDTAKSKRLKKELKLFNIYAIATGATLSSGFFLLPGLAMKMTGASMILSYLIAAIPLIPGIFSIVELSTAMPKAGGVYYFLDRSLGPMIGTIGGVGVWLVVILKTVFALVGIGAYIKLFFPSVAITPLACSFAVLFLAINLLGAKKTALIQAILVFGVLFILVWFTSSGVQTINFDHFDNLFASGTRSIFTTAGFLCVSYVGLTQIASVAEEVENPERNLPLGIFLALGTAILVYGVGSFVMVGVVPTSQLSGSLTPVADTARILGGKIGTIVITFAAVFAFSSVANAGILSASRYPLALSRDHIFPLYLQKVNKWGVPTYSVFLTFLLIIFFLVGLEPTKIAKLASAFQLLMFAIACLAVFIMRESHIESYDPGYRSPFYPWMHILGFFAPLWFIAQLGYLSILFTVALIALSTLWYFYYARQRVTRGGAIFHYFARLGERKFEGLDLELRQILREKGLRQEDPFDDMIARAAVYDAPEDSTFESITKRCSEILSYKINLEEEEIKEKFLQGTKVGATPVSHGVALPHIRIKDLHSPELVIVRAKQGITIDLVKEYWGEEIAKQSVYAFFFLAGSEASPKQHLRILAQIAERIDGEGFLEDWQEAQTEQEFKEILLHEETFLPLQLSLADKTSALIGKELRELKWPDGTLVALINREEKAIIPRGSTKLKEHDRLTIIGENRGIRELRKQYEV